MSVNGQNPVNIKLYKKHFMKRMSRLRMNCLRPERILVRRNQFCIVNEFQSIHSNYQT